MVLFVQVSTGIRGVMQFIMYEVKLSTIYFFRMLFILNGTVLSLASSILTPKAIFTQHILGRKKNSKGVGLRVKVEIFCGRIVNASLPSIILKTQYI